MTFGDSEDYCDDLPVGDIKEEARRSSYSKNKNMKDKRGDPGSRSSRRRSSTRESSSRRQSSSRHRDHDESITTGSTTTDDAARQSSRTHENSRRRSTDRRKSSMRKEPSRRHSLDPDRRPKGESSSRRRESHSKESSRRKRSSSTRGHGRSGSSRGLHYDDESMEYSRESSSRVEYSREPSRRRHGSRKDDGPNSIESPSGNARDSKQTPDSKKEGSNLLAPALGMLQSLFGVSSSKTAISTSPTNSSVEDTDSESQERIMAVAGAENKKKKKKPSSDNLFYKRLFFGGAIFLFVSGVLGVVFVMGKSTQAELIATPAPTVSARPSMAPSVSMIPSDLPSMVPSDLPSNVPSLSTKPTTSPSATPSMIPSASPSSSQNPTWTRYSRNWDFKVRLQWQSDYLWQEEEDEMFWCLECVKCDEYGRGDWWEHGCRSYGSGDNRNCKDGDSVWIRDCRNRGNRFNVLQIDETTSFMLRLDNGDLCLERRNNHLMFRVCDEAEVDQQFVPWSDWSKFELRPLAMEGWRERDADCVSQTHHPKENEVVGMHNCRLSRLYETKYWERYG